MSPKCSRLGLLLVGSLLLTACYPDENTQASLPGSGGTGHVITRQDSLYAAGVIEQLSDDAIHVNGQTWQRSDTMQILPLSSSLHVGQMVYLRSTPARDIVQLWLRPQAQGVVEWVDIEAQRLSIHGMSIEWTDHTLWPIGRGTVVAGQVLQVFGEITQQGIIATRIDFAPAQSAPQLTLRIDGIDPSEHLLSHGASSYAYDAALTEDQLPSVNQCIHAQIALDPVPIEGVYTLSSFEQDLGRYHGVWMSVQGHIDSMKTPAIFQLGCYRVYSDAETLWHNMQAQDLSNGQAVRVEGVMREDGALQASSVFLVEAKQPSP